jgi:iron complex outermembrane receptor protein
LRRVYSKVAYRLNKKLNLYRGLQLRKLNYEANGAVPEFVDDVAAPIRGNVRDSYKLGLEIDAVFKLSDKFNIQPNIALSTNKNIDFTTNWDGELVELGTTNISFSPNIILGNAFNYLPLQNL